MDAADTIIVRLAAALCKSALQARHNKLISQRQLLKDVWGPTNERETNYLRVFMAQIRHKLEPEPSRPRYFITEPRMGYRFVPGARESPTTWGPFDERSECEALPTPSH
jgi:DNA-binding winged helix-turn-helix (wHTH) protein